MASIKIPLLFSSVSGSYYAVFDDYALGSGVTPNKAWIHYVKYYLFASVSC